MKNEMNNVLVFSRELKHELLVGYLEINDIKVRPSDAEIDLLVKNAENDLPWKLDDLQCGIFQAYRNLWWRYGMDPTKLRPSGEALVRRVLLGNPLYRVNNVVDIANVISIKHGLSIGLHDLDKLKLPIQVRLAGEGERFQAIGSKGEKVLQGGELIVSDQQRQIDLAFSTSSCEITKITNQTKNCLVVIYAPAEVGSPKVMEALLEIGLLMEKSAGGKAASPQVFKNSR